MLLILTWFFRLQIDDAFSIWRFFSVFVRLQFTLNIVAFSRLTIFSATSDDVIIIEVQLSEVLRFFLVCWMTFELFCNSDIIICSHCAHSNHVSIALIHLCDSVCLSDCAYSNHVSIALIHLCDSVCQSCEYSIDPPLWFCLSVRMINPKRLKLKSPESTVIPRQQMNIRSKMLWIGDGVAGSSYVECSSYNGTAFCRWNHWA